MSCPHLHISRTDTGPAETRSTVAFVHGVGGRSGEWDRVVAELPPGFDVLRYDLRGHGESDKPAGPYHLADFVADHVRVLDEVGIEKCHLVGESMGGLISQAIAIEHPERVDRLVLLAAIAGRTPEEAEASLARWRQLADGGLDRSWLEVSASRWFTEGFLRDHPEEVDAFLSTVAANDHEPYAAAYGVLAQNDLADDLHRIRARTLVMTGEGDVGSTPRMSELMAQRIPDATLQILPGVKHLPSVETPHDLATRISDFFTVE
jgi:pimeloyl-ACP methyl ester carboxylesterase